MLRIYKPRLVHIVWNVFSFLLTCVVVVLILISYTTPPNAQALRMIEWIDNIACVIFFSEFLMRFSQAPNKLRYMRWGWIDLLASIPISFFRFARLLKIFALLRLFFIIRRSVRIHRAFYRRYTPRDIAGLVFLFFILCIFLLISLASTLVLLFEEGHGGSIQSAAEAVWWTLVTITTVGYGDYSPITVGGRFIAIVLMFSGIGLFSTLTVYISSFLLQFLPKDKNDSAVVMTGEELGNELRHIQEGIRDLHVHQQALEELLSKKKFLGGKESLDGEESLDHKE